MSNQLPSGDTSLLAEVHATSSGLKVLATTTAIQDLEVARRSMGGHGYSAFSGLGRIYADYVPSATCVVILCQLWHTDKSRLKRYEGDNYVLDEQVVRAALKSHKNLLSAKDPSASLLSPSSYCLRFLVDGSDRMPSLTNAWWKDLTSAVLLLEWRAALVVQDLALNQSNPDASANQRVSKAVVEAYVAVQVARMIQELELTDEDKSIVGDLYRLVSGLSLHEGKRTKVLSSISSRQWNRVWLISYLLG